MKEEEGARGGRKGRRRGGQESDSMRNLKKELEERGRRGRGKRVW